jgi:hypothetical protein
MKNRRPSAVETWRLASYEPPAPPPPPQPDPIVERRSSVRRMMQSLLKL